jgi:hypothetical protein
VEKITLYWADQSSQGRIKISCTDRTSPTNQPRKDPIHLYFISPNLPLFQWSAWVTPLWSLSLRQENTHSDTDRQSLQNYLNNFLDFLLRLLGDRIVRSAAQILANLNTQFLLKLIRKRPWQLDTFHRGFYRREDDSLENGPGKNFSPD